jgi:choline dehydrogenase-like flavoprotein
MTDYDVIIIGTGARGGSLARHLAPSGKKIQLLERGGWLPREPRNWSMADVSVDRRYISPDTWYDHKGKTFQPQVHLLRRRGHQSLRRGALSLAGEGLRRAQVSRWDLSRVADRVLGHGAVLHAGRAAL